jgi:hypothetical protein
VHTVLHTQGNNIAKEVILTGLVLFVMDPKIKQSLQKTYGKRAGFMNSLCKIKLKCFYACVIEKIAAFA